jgi:hypothetical protein
MGAIEVDNEFKRAEDPLGGGGGGGRGERGVEDI